MKVYIFKLKNQKEIYAYTIDKEYCSMFKIQRNMKLFDSYTVDMEKYEFMIFSNRYNKLQICRDYLHDGENDIEIFSTIDESDLLSEYCNYIFNTAESISYSLSMGNYPLKKRYLNIINKLTEIITKRGENHPTLNVNTFKLFYFLFSNTFSEYQAVNENYNNQLNDYE